MSRRALAAALAGLAALLALAAGAGAATRVQVAANDAAGRLLLLDKTSGRILALDPRTGSQTLYSRVSDLALCSTVARRCLLAGARRPGADARLRRLGS